MNFQKNEIIDLVYFFHSVCNLKRIKRSGWIYKSNIKSPESIADHSYSMCVISMILSDILNLNTEYVMKMVNLHDLSESLIGDFMPSEISAEKKKILQDEAIKKILSKIPTSLRKNYLNIWNEYMDNSTETAKFVHNVDKLEMALQAKEYEFDGYSKELLQVFLKSATDYISKEKYGSTNKILQSINDELNRI